MAGEENEGQRSSPQLQAELQVIYSSLLQRCCSGAVIAALNTFLASGGFHSCDQELGAASRSFVLLYQVGSNSVVY